MTETTATRDTRQKRALADLLDTTDEFRSAQDLHAVLRAGGTRVGLTTVYNQLKYLVDSGAVDTIRNDDGESLFRRCSTAQHHHHLVCRRCGRTVEVEATDVEAWATHVARKAGFSAVEHTIELKGTCRSCRAQDTGRSPAG